jgi:hypothetical protein
MKHLFSLFKNNYPKFIFGFFVLLLSFSYLRIFAIGSPYQPGATLDPACQPSEVNCIVSYDLTFFKQDGNSFAGTATLGTNDANPLVFETNNTERMRITPNGRLSLGAGSIADTTFSTMLVVQGPSTGRADVSIQNTNPSNRAQIAVSNDTGRSYITFDVYGSTQSGTFLGGALTAANSLFLKGNIDDSGFMVMGPQTATPLLLVTNNVERIRILSSGLVGIGTTTPTAKLQVVGSVTASSAIARGVYANNTLVAAANNDVLVGLDISNTFTNGAFTGVANYGLRVAGNILFGSDLSSSYMLFDRSASQFVIRGSDTQQHIKLINSNNVNVGIGIEGSMTNYGMGVYYGGTAIASFESTGGLIIGGTYTTTVDSIANGLIVQGSTLIGTSTNAGYKLDVNGTFRTVGAATITGAATVGTTLGVTGAITATANGHQFGNLQILTSANASTTGQGIRVTGSDSTLQFQGSAAGGNPAMFTFAAYNSNATTSALTTTDKAGVRIYTGFEDGNVGSISGNTLWLSPTYDFTSNPRVGLKVRGIYYDPTLTDLTATTHIAIETVSGDNYFGSTSGSTGIGYTSGAALPSILSVRGGATFQDSGSNSKYLFQYGSGAWLAMYDATPTETVRIRAGGGATYFNSGQNFLIGTATDSTYKLDVVGNTRSTSTNGSPALTGVNTSNSATDAVLSLTAVSSGFLKFGGSGGMLIGGGSAGGAGPIAQVKIRVQATSGQTANVQTWEDSTNAVLSSVTSNGSFLIARTTDSGYKLQVGSSAVVGIVARFENSTGTCDINPTTTSLACSSDQNLKKNIQSLDTSILDKVLSLNPVTYNWNTESDSTPLHNGFIAQEVESIFPDLVFTDATTGLKSLNYMGLIPYTVKALQQLNLKVSMLPDISDATLMEKISSFLEGVANGKVQTEEVQTDKLCVGSVCVTQEQFLNMINNSNSSSSSSGSESTPTPPAEDPVIIEEETPETPVVEEAPVSQDEGDTNTETAGV